MDRNEREARAYEREAKESRKQGNHKRAKDMQAHADGLREAVRLGRPVYKAR